MGLREARINRIEPAAILRAEIGRRPACRLAAPGCRAGSARSGWRRGLGRDLGLDAAQSIVGAELDDRTSSWSCADAPSAQASRARPPARGIAGDAGTAHAHGQAFGGRARVRVGRKACGDRPYPATRLSPMTSRRIGVAPPMTGRGAAGKASEIIADQRSGRLIRAPCRPYALEAPAAQRSPEEHLSGVLIRSASPAIRLEGVHLQPDQRGRTGARPARHRSGRRAGRNGRSRRPVRLREDQPADGHRRPRTGDGRPGPRSGRPRSGHPQ